MAFSEDGEGGYSLTQQRVFPREDCVLGVLGVLGLQSQPGQQDLQLGQLLPGHRHHHLHHQGVISGLQVRPGHL